MTCPRCDGSGSWKVFQDTTDCPTCDGSGRVPVSTWTRYHRDVLWITYSEWRGWWRARPFWGAIECPACDGEGGEQQIVGHLGVPGGAFGPYFPCGYCDGWAYVTPWRWLVWHYWIVDPPALVWEAKRILIRLKSGEWVPR